jgi:hypothetical protein
MELGSMGVVLATPLAPKGVALVPTLIFLSFFFFFEKNILFEFFLNKIKNLISYQVSTSN